MPNVYHQQTAGVGKGLPVYDVVANENSYFLCVLVYIRGLFELDVWLCFLCSYPILILYYPYPQTPPTRHASQHRFISVHQTNSDKMKFSALVSATFVALAAAACKNGEYSWYVK